MEKPGTILAQAAVWLIRGYQLLLSPLLGPRCRFYPSCSAYCAEAIARHGLLRGCWLGLVRLLRCHPFGPAWRHDPVPPVKQASACCRPRRQASPEQ